MVKGLTFSFLSGFPIMKRHSCTIILPTTSNINSKCNQSIQSTLPYSQSAFYPSLQFAVYIFQITFSLHFIPGLQSEVCSPHSAILILRQDHIHCLSSELFMPRFAKVCQRESNTKTFYFCPEFRLSSDIQGKPIR